MTYVLDKIIKHKLDEILVLFKASSVSVVHEHKNSTVILHEVFFEDEVTYKYIKKFSLFEASGKGKISLVVYNRDREADDISQTVLDTIINDLKRHYEVFNELDSKNQSLRTQQQLITAQQEQIRKLQAFYSHHLRTPVSELQYFSRDIHQSVAKPLNKYRSQRILAAADQFLYAVESGTENTEMTVNFPVFMNNILRGLHVNLAKRNIQLHIDIHPSLGTEQTLEVFPFRDIFQSLQDHLFLDQTSCLKIHVHKASGQLAVTLSVDGKFNRTRKSHELFDDKRFRALYKSPSEVKIFTPYEASTIPGVKMNDYVVHFVGISKIYAREIDESLKKWGVTGSFFSNVGQYTQFIQDEKKLEADSVIFIKRCSKRYEKILLEYIRPKKTKIFSVVAPNEQLPSSFGGNFQIEDVLISPFNVSQLIYQHFSFVSEPVMVEEKRRILIADDEMSVLHVAQNWFTDKGYDVHTAMDGRLALSDIIESEMYDGIILDIQMPGLTGNEVALAARKLGKSQNVPIVAITANTTLLDDAVSDAFDKVFVKPVDWSKIEQYFFSGQDISEGEEEKFVVPEKHDPGNNSLFDIQQWDYMCEILFKNEDEKKYYIGQYEQYLLTDIPDIKHVAADKRDKVYHKIKSAAKNIGAITLADSLEKFEKLAKEQKNEEIMTSHHELENIAEATWVELRRLSG